MDETCVKCGAVVPEQEFSNVCRKCLAENAELKEEEEFYESTKNR